MQEKSEVIIERNACVCARLGDWKINEENQMFRIQRSIAFIFIFFSDEITISDKDVCLYAETLRFVATGGRVIIFLAEAKDDIPAVVCVLVKLQTNASTKMACLQRDLPTVATIALHLVAYQLHYT